MKLISFTPAVLISIVSLSLNAFAETSPSDEGDIPSKIEDHLSKFKSYFRVHTSREHAAEEKALEKALELENAKRVQKARVAIQEDKAEGTSEPEVASTQDTSSLESVESKADAPEKAEILSIDKPDQEITITPES